MAMGATAPDGSPVDFYVALPSLGEAEIVHGAIPERSEILELGCGAGRMTHRLLELGHPVVAVDDSPEMLAHVRDARAVCARIEGLNLGRTFPVVLLASHLVNTADRRQQRAFLDTCSSHADPGGTVLIQRADPSRPWAPGTESDSTVKGMRIRTRVLSGQGTTFSAVGEYTIGQRTWTHAYRTEILDDDAFGKALDRSGLRLERWLDERRTWAQAVKEFVPNRGAGE